MTWVAVAFAAGWPPAWTIVWALLVDPAVRRNYGPQVGARLDRLDRVAWPWLNAAVSEAAGDVIAGQPVALAISAFQVAVALFIWWYRRRRNRRKTLAALGGRALARLASMLRALRDNARPSPLLRPVPGGAR